MSSNIPGGGGALAPGAAGGRFLPAAIAGLFLAGAGCSTPSYSESDDHYYRNDPARVQESYAAAIEDHGPNALIGIEKLLAAALLRQEWEDAEMLAIRASTLVNIFVAGERGERDALSLFGQEKDKPFKGEPHEQAMVDFYLGLLRFRARDYEGALAAFRSAMLKDRGTFLLPVEAAQAKRNSDNVQRFLYADDYVALKFFAAKCYQLLGESEEAGRHLAEAKALRPELAPLLDQGMAAEENVIVVIEGGRAPRKIKTGPRGAILGYTAEPTTTVEAVDIDGRMLSFAPVDDLHVQATTLGGRKVDDLNRTKAERQEAIKIAGFSTTAAGYGLLVAGSAAHDHQTRQALQAAGAAVMVAGLLTMVFAEAAIDPSADTRAWSLLPGQIILAFGRAPPGGEHALHVRARGAGGDESQAWTGVPVEEGVNLYWLRLLPGRRGGVWRSAGEPPPAASNGTS